MNENINLVEILKDCPKNTVFWSKVHGKVKFQGIRNSIYPISVIYYTNTGCSFEARFTKEGLANAYLEGECILVPSKSQQDWSKWKHPKPKFNPKTLQPFDKILVFKNEWICRIISHIKEDMIYVASGGFYDYCIPYNKETKHLVGTTEEAPEFYRYWEN